MCNDEERSRLYNLKRFYERACNYALANKCEQDIASVQFYETPVDKRLYADQEGQIRLLETKRRHIQ